MTTQQEAFGRALAAVRAFRDRYQGLETLVEKHATWELRDSALEKEIVAYERLLSTLDDDWPSLALIHREARFVHRLLVKKLGIGFAPPGHIAGRTRIRSLPGGRVGPCPLTEREETSLRTAFGVIERELEKLVEEPAAAPEKTREVPIVNADADTPAAADNPKVAIKPCQREAIESYERAIRSCPDLIDQPLHATWEWLQDNDPDTFYDLPIFLTWTAYRRQGLLVMTDPKNTPRAGRSHGGSVVSATEI